jgi:hypothetical protein
MFLLVCSSFFSQQIVETKYFSNHNELGGDVIILKQFQRVEGTKSITSFEIKSPRSGRYYISFWLCPPKLNDGTFAGYDVSVNDTGVAGKILPNHGDWQSISLSDGEMIELKKGLLT